jgi:hypothetical protein
MKGYDDEELQTYASGLLACSNTELLLKLWINWDILQNTLEE